MGERSYYLPRKSVLDKMSDHDRSMVFDCHLSALRNEAQRIQEGSQTGLGGKPRMMKSVRDRMGRLIATANEYGLWLEEEDEEPAPLTIRLPSKALAMVRQFLETKKQHVVLD